MSDSTRRKTAVGGSILGAGVLLVLALAVMVNYFGWKYHQRFDWTGKELYSLSEKSLNVVGALGEQIVVTVFLSPIEEVFEPVRELLDRYDAASQRIRVRYVDAERNPAEAQKLVEELGLTQLSVVVFEGVDDRRVIDTADLADYDYSGVQFGQPPRLIGFKGEQAFTGAILELVERRKPTIVFIRGHGELGLDDFSPRGLSQAQEFLAQDNVEIIEWESLGRETVPDEASLLVLAAPTANLVSQELDLLTSYLDGGGRLLVLLDPDLDTALGERPTIESWLEGYGVEVGRDLVVDPANPLPFFGPETIFVDDYPRHPINESLAEAGVPVILTLARSVAAADVDDLIVSELLRTSAEGWGETDLDNLLEVKLDDVDLAGPVALGVAVTTLPAGEPEPSLDEPLAEAADAAGAVATRPGFRMVVIGDSDFASNSQLANAGNPTLLANSVNWLLERETLVGIPPKTGQEEPLNLTAAQLSGINWLVLAVLPGLALAAGGLVYYRRRR